MILGAVITDDDKFRVRWGGNLAGAYVARDENAFGDRPWCVWIPYTKPEHLDYGDLHYPTSLEEWEDIVDNAPVLGPWGDTFWPTWREAYDFAYGVMHSADNPFLEEEALMSNLLDDYLHRFEARASDDEVKTDLELICTECGTHICDIEAGDNLRVLASVARDHACSEEDA